MALLISLIQLQMMKPLTVVSFICWSIMRENPKWKRPKFWIAVWKVWSNVEDGSYDEVNEHKTPLFFFPEEKWWLERLWSRVTGGITDAASCASKPSQPFRRCLWSSRPTRPSPAIPCGVAWGRPTCCPFRSGFVHGLRGGLSTVPASLDDGAGPEMELSSRSGAGDGGSFMTASDDGGDGGVARLGRAKPATVMDE